MENLYKTIEDLCRILEIAIGMIQDEAQRESVRQAMDDVMGEEVKKE